MKNQNKILHVIGKRPKGGVGTFLMNMHENIDTTKIQFDYLINESMQVGDFENKAKQLGGKVFVLPELNYRNTFKYLKELHDFYKNYHNNYEIIHFHSVNIAIFNFLFARRYGIKSFIAHSHSTKSSDKFINRIRNFFLQLPIKKICSSYLACSLQAATYLYGETNVLANKVVIIKNGINPDKFKFNLNTRKEKKKLMKIEDKFVIGHVGEFLPVKNHSYLIDIFNEIYKNIKHFYISCCIISDIYRSKCRYKK